MNDTEYLLVIGLAIINMIALTLGILRIRQARKEGYKQGEDESIGCSMSKVRLMNYRIEEIDYHVGENPFLVVEICGKYLQVELYRKDLCNFFGKYWVEFDNEKKLEVVKEVPGYYKFTHNGILLKA